MRIFARVLVVLGVLIPCLAAAQGISISKKIGGGISIYADAKKLEAKLRSLNAAIKKENAAPPVLPDEPGRKSQAKLWSPRLSFKVTVSSDEQARMQARAELYSAREAKASTEVRGRLERLRSLIKAQRLSFTVGLTSVTGKDLSRITGIRGEPDAKAASAHNREVLKPGGASLLRAEMRQRALPPARARTTAEERDEEEDGPVTASTAIVRPDQVAGTRDAEYPSSAFPSPSAPAFSWRDRAGPSKSQEECGACWAFATAAAFEVADRAYNGTDLIDISEQHLVNCVPPTVASGNNCDGQWPDVAYDYLKTHGAALASQVPYRAKMDRCDPAFETGPKVGRWAFVGRDPRAPTVDELKQALVLHGPLAATVRVTEAFQNYTGGVFDERDPGIINHAVTIMGWDDARGAFHVLNSWGTDWGEDGYIWVKYGSNRIGSYATWSEPLAKKQQPALKTFDTRAVVLENTNREPITAFVQLEESRKGKWNFKPAKAEEALKFTVPANGKVEVRWPHNNKLAFGRSIKVWGESANKKRAWNTYKERPLTIVASPYAAAKRERYVHTFGNPDEPPLDANVLWAQAHDLRNQRQYESARALFARFVSAFPAHDNTHAARYWLGFCYFKEKNYWDAVDALYAMTSKAPDDDPNLGLAFYYMASSYVKLGYCGYAVRNFDVVAHGELNVSARWVKGAKSWIDRLYADDGRLCGNWE